MTPAELERKLKKETNCRFVEHRNGHAWWLNPETGEQFKISCHSSQEIPKGTLNSIFKSAGLK